MKKLRGWIVRIGGLFDKQRKDQELDAEIESHLQMHIDDNLRLGMTSEEARRQAVIQLGGVESTKEAYRDQRGLPILETALRDVRFALRSLQRAPGFTAIAVLTLALGLGLATSTMAIVNAYFIQSLPVPEAKRLYRVVYSPNGVPEPSRVETLDWESLGDVVEIADYSTDARFYVMWDGSIQETRGLLAAPGSLEALGVRAMIGRSFSEEDFHRGAENIALIGHSMWRDRFGSDPNIVGRELIAGLANRPDPPELMRIIGVLPPDFRYVRVYARDPAQIVAPLRSPSRTYMVRLREGVPAAFAESRITDAVKRAGAAFPSNWTGVKLESIHEDYVRELRPVVKSITVAVGLVLVIVVANIAVLSLLRAMRRQREMAVRAALGAGRRHLVRMLVAEASLLCAVALAGALALTAFSLSLMAPLIEARLGKPVPGGLSALQISPTVLLVIAGLAVILAFALSLIPLFIPQRRYPADTLRGDARAGSERPATRHARSVLISFEVAASMALLVACGLMVRSVTNMLQTDLGYRSTQILRARLQLPPGTYPEPATFMRFYERFTERVTAIPDTQCALATFVPFFENPKQSIEVDGRKSGGIRVSVLAATEGYLPALEIGQRLGRGISSFDRAGTEPVVVISKSLASQLWPSGDALGRRIRALEQNADPSRPAPVWRTIVGVVEDVRQTYDRTEDRNDIYIPLAQQPERFFSVLIRTDRPQAFWEERLRKIIAEVDPHVMGQVSATLSAEIEKRLSGPKFLMSIMTGFAIFAAFLATIGIYGVTAYAVQQREREVAVRVAMGATNSAVMRLFLKEGGMVLAIGIGLGLLATYAVARILENQVYGVRPFDAATVLAAGAFMAATGLLATAWPVRRAILKEPMSVLKEG